MLVKSGSSPQMTTLWQVQAFNSDFPRFDIFAVLMQQYTLALKLNPRLSSSARILSKTHIAQQLTFRIYRISYAPYDIKHMIWSLWYETCVTYAKIKAFKIKKFATGPKSCLRYTCNLTRSLKTLLLFYFLQKLDQKLAYVNF